MGNKLSNITVSKADGKDINPEFEYRYETLKKLRESNKSLKKSVTAALTNMDSTPKCLREVGAGYAGMTACLSHGGTGGSTSRRQSRADGADQGGSKTKIDRDLADESYQMSQNFCNAMDDVKSGLCAKYRAEIQDKIAAELEKLSKATEQAIAQGKKTEDQMSRHGASRKSVKSMESAAAKKGKDVTANKSYAKAVSERDTKEKAYQSQLDGFDSRYEEVLVMYQEFCATTTDIFLDNVVNYYREMIKTLDYSDTPQRSRVREREAQVAHTERAPGAASREPAVHENSRSSSFNTEDLKKQ